MLAFLIVVPLVATAQTTTSTNEEVIELESFQVTGSFITRFETEETLPITTLTSDSFSEEGLATGGEIYTDLVFTGAAEFNESEDGPNDARGDVTSINLRSIGSAYTLVLLNGRRLAPHPLNQTIDSTPSVLVNSNIMPAGLIDRIEILRDGASALYGTDASAGVVNTLLSRDLEGQELRFRYGFTEQGSYDETLLTYSGGFDFNDGRSNLTLFASHFERDSIPTTERDYASPGDKRPLVPEWFRGDTSIRNDSSSSPFPNLQAPSRLRLNGSSITDSRGRFHVLPGGIPLGNEGDRSDLTLPNGFDVIIGTLDRPNRYDTVPLRTLTSAAERINLFANLNHELTEDLNLFAEVGYYSSETSLARAPSNISSSAAITIPAQNHWNPFGPVTFSDGSPNPNRIDGITINGDPLPDEGIPIALNNWRAADFGQRLVDVENESILATVGLSGRAFEDWYWETALRYNINEATDTETGRFSKTGFEQVLARETPDALNVFAGPGVNDPANVEPASISVTRVGETELFSYDLRATTPNLFELFGNPVGVAFGGELRMESYEDDRDPRIDGTIRFDDSVNGASDVIGVSPTPDTSAERDVYGFFAEAAIPLVGEANRMPLFHRMELQLAARFEHYDDFGDVTRPKIGASWYPVPDLMVRSSYAEGFTAPNLSLLTQPIQRSNEGIDDEYRIQFDPDNPANDGTDPVSELRGGGINLGPEDSETFTVGTVLRVPGIEGLTLSADYFNIKITDIILIESTADVLEDERDILNALAFDASVQPGDTPAATDLVRRRPVTAQDIAVAQAAGRYAVGAIDQVINTFRNGAVREVEGVDFGLEYVFPETNFGRFTLEGNASLLEDYIEQAFVGGPINDDILGDADEAQPEFRARGNLSWRKDNWRARVNFRYISGVTEDDVDSDEDLDPTGVSREWEVDEYWEFGASGSYTFDEGMFEGTRLLFGVRNLLDENPPLNPDESYGYESNLHSNRGRFYYAEVRYEF